MKSSKAERTRNMRYKRPALASMGDEDLMRELEEIQEACSDIHWFTDQDDDTLLNALDGDEEDAYEFRIAFADLEAKADHLCRLFYELGGHDDPAWQVYNDCTVALIGNRYRVVGFDMDEEDYFSLTSYEQNLACTESGKRVMWMTKASMLSTIGQCVGILVSFLDLRQSYDYLKATFDILRDTNTSLLDTIKEISKAYEAAEMNHFYPWYEETKHFDRLLSCLPQRAWVE